MRSSWRNLGKKFFHVIGAKNDTFIYAIFVHSFNSHFERHYRRQSVSGLLGVSTHSNDRK